MLREVTFFDMARSADVKRWHIINTTRPQTLAEHSFMVTLIALEFVRLVQIDHDEPLFDSPTEYNRFIGACLFHDMPETVYGDLPTPGKKLLREFVENPRMFDELDQQVMPYIPYCGGLLSPKLLAIIHLADLIEAYYFLTNNGSGVYAEQINEDLYKRLIAHGSKLAVDIMPTWTVSPAIGTIMKDMGLRGGPTSYDTPKKDERI